MARWLWEPLDGQQQTLLEASAPSQHTSISCLQICFWMQHLPIASGKSRFGKPMPLVSKIAYSHCVDDDGKDHAAFHTIHLHNSLISCLTIETQIARLFFHQHDLIKVA